MNNMRFNRLKLVAGTCLVAWGAGVIEVGAQQVALPPVTVQPAAKKAQTKKAAQVKRQAKRVAAPAATQVAAPPNIQTGQAGTSGYVATRTSTGTKTDTPIVNIPQSINVLTREFIRDGGFQSLNDGLRYVPGVIPHQGESHRDDIVIRGQRTNADFFTDGIRDDVQYFRDLYNIYRVEVLKGPNAMIFGRGGGGGIVNRVLKEADFVPIHEVTIQGGMFNNKRIAVDFGGPLNSIAVIPDGSMPVKAPLYGASSTWAGRINAVYENSDSYRDFVNIERYGVNPTFTYRPNDQTWVKFSYEYFHDRRVTDRGIPSVTGTGAPYKTSPSQYFGNPDLNYALLDAHIGNVVINHLTDSGLNIRNATRVASFDKFYQNVYPGSAVNPATGNFNLTAYNNETDRKNLFNQTDFTYKLDLGWTRHTLLAGVEVGRQTGLSFRQEGFFNNVQTTWSTPAANSVNFTPVTFRWVSGANNTYKLDLAAVYFQDQIEVSRYLQFILGVRFDRFDMSSQSRVVAANSYSRIDNLVSPRAGVIMKPMENLSIYGSYSVSYLPSAGDQFSSLSPGLVLAEPEKFENQEIGLKWEISPRLLFQTAVYNLDRTNQRLPDPSGNGLFILSGRTETKGFEASVTGYITEAWQMVGGYAYTDARIASRTSATIVEGNRVGLVPYNVFTLWNKYQFNEMWAAGVGIIHQTSSYASSSDIVTLPGWTRVDAALYGKINQHFRWQINAENIFNTKYYSTADGDNNITPGSPFAVRGTLIANY